jgi:hypothetical protein
VICNSALRTASRIVVSAPNWIRIGTTLETTPAERRSATVVLAETGRLSTTSGLPVTERT